MCMRLDVYASPQFHPISMIFFFQCRFWVQITHSRSFGQAFNLSQVRLPFPLHKVHYYSFKALLSLSFIAIHNLNCFYCPDRFLIAFTIVINKLAFFITQYLFFQTFLKLFELCDPCSFTAFSSGICPRISFDNSYFTKTCHQRKELA